MSKTCSHSALWHRQRLAHLGNLWTAVKSKHQRRHQISIMFHDLSLIWNSTLVPSCHLRSTSLDEMPIQRLPRCAKVWEQRVRETMPYSTNEIHCFAWTSFHELTKDQQRLPSALPRPQSLFLLVLRVLRVPGAEFWDLGELLEERGDLGELLEGGGGKNCQSFTANGSLFS